MVLLCISSLLQCTAMDQGMLVITSYVLDRRTAFAYFLISGNFKIHSIETWEQSRKKLERRMKDEKGFSSVPWLCCAVITAKVWRTVRCPQVYLREALLNTCGSMQEGMKEHMNFKITLWADCRCGSTYPCWIRIWWIEKGCWGPSFSVVKQRELRG